jgi:hypothetical protein
MGERQHPMMHLQIIPRGLPPDCLPLCPEVILRLLAGGGKVGHHDHRWWWMEVGKKWWSAQRQGTGGKRNGSKGSVDLIYGFHPLYLLLQQGTDLCGA